MRTFDVVVTSYNYRQYVTEAIDGALAQTRPPQRVVVVDDGSSDGSPELLRQRYGDDSRVILVCGDNGGQLAAFQRGVAHCTADVICFLDSDDRWKPDYLAAVGALYDERSDVDFVFSDMQVFGTESRTIAFTDRAIDLGHTLVSTYALTCWYGVPTSAISMRASWARRVLDLPPSQRVTWRLSADCCLVYGASMLGAHKYYLPTGQVDYRIHGANGWWSNRGARTAYLSRLHARRLIAHYAEAFDIDDSCLELAKLEFRTKPAPDRDETRRYIEICTRSRAPWWKRIEQMLGILRHRSKSQRTR